MKQQHLFREKVLNEFGGSLFKKGQRKVARPLSTKRPIHLVLKAKSANQLLRNRIMIQERAEKLGQKFGIKLYAVAVQADHIHVALRIFSRRMYNAWIRSLTGTLSRVVKGLNWKLRPYTRIARWGQEFRRLAEYLDFNVQEAELIIGAWQVLKKFSSGLRDKSAWALKIEIGRRRGGKCSIRPHAVISDWYASSKLNDFEIGNANVS